MDMIKRIKELGGENTIIPASYWDQKRLLRNLEQIHFADSTRLHNKATAGGRPSGVRPRGLSK